MLSINYYVCVDDIAGIINITLMLMEAAVSAATSHPRCGGMVRRQDGERLGRREGRWRGVRQKVRQRHLIS